jgi:hypothetical protein
MLGSPNLRRGNAPLAMRLKIDDLHAQLAPLDRYGFGGLSSAMTDGFRALIRSLKSALLALFAAARMVAATPRPSDPRPELDHLRLRRSADILSVAFVCRIG